VTPAAEVEELYEEEPRRRPWASIANVMLALAVVFVGYQWQQASSREQTLAAQAQALRAEAESLRLRAEEGQRQLGEVQKRLAQVSAEKTTLEERVASLEKGSKEAGSTIARDGTRRVTPTAASTGPGGTAKASAKKRR
jgi:uncharacterized protein YlxW (UPF0749 family)